MACPASRDVHVDMEADRDRLAGCTVWHARVTAWQLGLPGGAPDRPKSCIAVTEVWHASKSGMELRNLGLVMLGNLSW